MRPLRDMRVPPNHLCAERGARWLRVLPEEPFFAYWTIILPVIFGWTVQ